MISRKIESSLELVGSYESQSNGAKLTGVLISRASFISSPELRRPSGAGNRWYSSGERNGGRDDVKGRYDCEICPGGGGAAARVPATRPLDIGPQSSNQNQKTKAVGGREGFMRWIEKGEEEGLVEG